MIDKIQKLINQYNKKIAECQTKKEFAIKYRTEARKTSNEDLLIESRNEIHRMLTLIQVYVQFVKELEDLED